MKYIITGSLGHISRPVVAALTAAGHTVTVISSQADRATNIQSLGATAAIGSLTDAAFVEATFKNADSVYLMIPPNYAVTDFSAYQREVANNYIAALRGSSVKQVVLLSSIGAHLREGAGPIDGLGYLEEQLHSLSGINVTILRPAYFFYNLLNLAGLLKTAGIVGSNFGSDKEKMALVHHLDIADRVLHHLTHPATGTNIEYVVSDERYTSDIAAILGNRVGKPQTAWITFSDEDSLNAMTAQGLNPSLASEYVEMGQSFRHGRAQEHYWQTATPPIGTRKLESFTDDFAAAYERI